MFPSFSSKDIDALSEAYASVYESSHLETDTKKRHKDNEKAIEDMKKTKGYKDMTATAKKKMEEEVYNLILSHLLSEGFADNATSALAIMANMSEEWRDTILEAREARENPEKHEEEKEKEEDKKYGKVRGESRPMPPRGNKDREAFEKWYASQRG